MPDIVEPLLLQLRTPLSAYSRLLNFPMQLRNYVLREVIFNAFDNSVNLKPMHLAKYALRGYALRGVLL